MPPLAAVETGADWWDPRSESERSAAAADGDTDDPDTPVYSTLRCDAAHLFPYRPPVRWCRCLHCGYRDGRVLLYSRDEAASQAARQLMLPLAYPYTHEYFDPEHGDGFDLVFGSVVPGPYPGGGGVADLEGRSEVGGATSASCYGTCARIVAEPSFIVAVHWTRHVWHLLYDLLQPVYNMMQRTYGAQSTNVRFWIHRDERDSDAIPEDCEGGGNDEGKGESEGGGRCSAGKSCELTPLEVELQLATQHDRPTRMMRLFSAWPFGDKSELDTGLTTCFDDLHVGLDPRGTAFAYGIQHQPHYAMLERFDESTAPPATVEMVKKNLAFKRFMQDGLGFNGGGGDVSGDEKSVVTVKEESEASFLASSASRAENLTMIQRRGIRQLTNQDELVRIATSAVESVEEVRLESMNFTAQLELFKRTTILFAVHGQALSNVLFMREGGVVILVNEPGEYQYQRGIISQCMFNVYMFPSNPLIHANSRPRGAQVGLRQLGGRLWPARHRHQAP
mmetsp:Transcript_36688/g.98350  ORF Transcript_36688/g.98350 Transcript_36688/m.98350 type:complete len:507 (-) Transcript_36688:353-1873(-)